MNDLATHEICLPDLPCVSISQICVLDLPCIRPSNACRAGLPCPGPAEKVVNCALGGPCSGGIKIRIVLLG